MNIQEIVSKYLTDNGYDGLYENDYECSCEKDELFPCDSPMPNCSAGYKGPCDCEEEHEFHIGAKKPEAKHG